MILPYADTEGMKIFLEGFSNQLKDYRVIMVMDGAAWHKSQALGKFNNIAFYPPAAIFPRT